jgi:hypothetical protein
MLYVPYRMASNVTVIATLVCMLLSQRWRLEDVPWEIVCVNRLTNTNRTVRTYTNNNLDAPPYDILFKQVAQRKQIVDTLQV